MTSHTNNAAPPADLTASSYRAWGAPPSSRYETLAQRWRPVFARIRATAVERDVTHRLPHDEIKWLRESGFLRARLSVEHGGSGVTLPELFALLVELGAADTNVANAIRAHLGFVEDVLTAHETTWQSHWRSLLSDGALIGAGLSETGTAAVGTFATKLTRNKTATGTDIRLNGEKFYTTGSLFANWITAAAQEGDATVYLQLPRDAPGVEVLDDWDGFGQALTASGTARFTNVEIKPEWIRPTASRFPYAVAFYQLAHLASLAGIGRALAEDVANRVRLRDRVYSHGNAARVADDPQILQVVGRLHGAAYAARSVTLQAARALQGSYEAHIDPASTESQRTSETHLAHVEVDQSVSVITRLVLDASTDLFDALGASATLRTAGLDRYWRNARTISSHNPRIYRERQVGAFAVNGTPPPDVYRVGKTTSAA
jgi:alkylation response protein AidB-like acyl-CoA dehydrogenase